MTPPPPRDAGSAYGLTFIGPIPGEARDLGLLSPPVTGWPEVIHRVENTEPARPARPEISADSAVVPLADGGVLTIERSPARVTHHRARPLDAHRLVHPGLAWPAAVFAHWMRRACLHGGAVVGAAGAWAILAHKSGGKSTTLAELARQGRTVLSDDLVVVRQGSVCAGPRVADLRKESALRWKGATLTPVRPEVDGGRHRAVLGPCPHEVELVGVLCLWFGRDEVVRRAEPTTRLSRLSLHRALHHPPADPIAMLDLTTLPVFDIVRPRSWEAFGRTMEVINELLDTPGASTAR